MATILSLPTELLIDIFKLVGRLDCKLPLYDFGSLVEPFDESYALRYEVNTSAGSLKALTQTCHKLRAVAYPLYYEYLAVGLGKEKVPFKELVGLLEIIKKHPIRGRVVKKLTVGPWLPRSIWTEAGFRDNKEEVERLKQVMKDHARDLGLGNEKFLAAVETGRHDVMLTLLIYSLPELVDLEMVVMSVGLVKPPYKVSSRWLEEALKTKSPRCSTTLKNFMYRLTGKCKEPWSGTLWEILKFPNLEGFKGEELGMRNFLQDPTAVPNLNGEGDDEDEDEEEEEEATDSDWESVDSDSAFDDEDEWQAPDGDNPWELEDPGTSVTKEISHDTQGLGCIPKEKTCNITKIHLFGFNTTLTMIGRLLAAPKNLHALLLVLESPRLNNYRQEFDDFKQGLLSQASSLNEFSIDSKNVVFCDIISQFTSLKRVECGNQLLGYKMPADGEMDISERLKWLPRSLTEITIFDHTSPLYWSLYIRSSKILRATSHDVLPNLQTVNFLVPVPLIRYTGFEKTKEVLKEKGIKFRYAPFRLWLDDYDKSLSLADKVISANMKKAVVEASDEDSDIELDEYFSNNGAPSWSW